MTELDTLRRELRFVGPEWTPCNKTSELYPVSFRKDAAPPLGLGERLRRQAICRSIDDKFRNNNAPRPADTLCHA
jgi:hypothetical protein